MIDAKISFAQAEAVAPTAPTPGRRLPPLMGLGLAAIASAGLWGMLAMAVSHLL